MGVPSALWVRDIDITTPGADTPVIQELGMPSAGVLRRLQLAKTTGAATAYTCRICLIPGADPLSADLIYELISSDASRKDENLEVYFVAPGDRLFIEIETAGSGSTVRGRLIVEQAINATGS